jgi:hypothetical protein
LSSPLGGGKEKRGRVREQERERERERETERGKCHLNGFPRAGVSGLGHRPYRMPNRLARHPSAKRRGTPVGLGGVPGAAP